MRGYPVSAGYMGYIDGSYKLFATENEYIEIWRELHHEERN